jgi:hypothetical protein
MIFYVVYKEYETHKTIKDLTNKIIAKNAGEYQVLANPELPEEEKEDNYLVDLSEANPEELKKYLKNS